MSCDGITCKRFASKVGYFDGRKYCSHCEVFFETKASRCICCNVKLRTKPNKKKEVNGVNIDQSGLLDTENKTNQMETVKTSVYLSKDDLVWVHENCINLSQFFRKLISQKRNKELEEPRIEEI